MVPEPVQTQCFEVRFAAGRSWFAVISPQSNPMAKSFPPQAPIHKSFAFDSIVGCQKIDLGCDDDNRFHIESDFFGITQI
jgi:hypothetical protein